MKNRPKIRKENGYSIIENAVVGLYYGLCVRPSGQIAREACMYSGNIFLETTDKNPVRTSAKSIMGIMTMEAHLGKTIRISVEGLDSEAERVALRLYSGITTPSPEDDFYFMDFNRFERE